MAYSLKENLMKEDRLSGGHRMCAGCGSPIAVRTVLRALNPEDKAVVCSATSCLEVSTFMYPYTAWKDLRRGDGIPGDEEAGQAG